MKQIDKKENDFQDIENIDAEVYENDLKPAVDDLSLNKILISLISDKKNISLKTELHNPLGLSVLNMLADYFESKDYPISAGILRDFIETYMEYMVSYKRKSRKEVIKALTGWMDKINTELSANTIKPNTEK